jgi:hypothetical protein
MRIRFNEEIGTITIDGVVISANVLLELVNPDRRLLFRFERKDGKIQATAFSEEQVLWLDRPSDHEVQNQAVEFDVLNEREQP